MVIGVSTAAEAVAEGAAEPLPLAVALLEGVALLLPLEDAVALPEAEDDAVAALD
jgi:hypothetical protein